jgi:hypothetical protein
VLPLDAIQEIVQRVGNDELFFPPHLRIFGERFAKLAEAFLSDAVILRNALLVRELSGSERFAGPKVDNLIIRHRRAPFTAVLAGGALHRGGNAGRDGQRG